MQQPNVNSVQLFRNVNDATVSLLDLAAKYKFTPDGTNIYVGFGQLVDRFLAGQDLLLPQHTGPIAATINALNSGSITHGTINLCLELDYPTGSTDPSQYFDFVTVHSNVLAPFAAALQSQVGMIPAGSTLDIVVRYASEMNAAGDIGDPYAGDPNGFKNTAPLVKQALDGYANLSLAFSPAINTGDGSLPTIQQYWPGPGVFDVTSCTWYARPTSAIPNPVTAYQTAFNRLSAYFNAFAPLTGNRIGIDELGGCFQNQSDNDDMLQRMFSGLASLPIPVEYATVFLSVNQAKGTYWGIDATLAFML